MQPSVQHLMANLLRSYSTAMLRIPLPAAAWLLAAKGIPAKSITATGPKGNIIKADVLDYLSRVQKQHNPDLESRPVLTCLIEISHDHELFPRMSTEDFMILVIAKALTKELGSRTTCRVEGINGIAKLVKLGEPFREISNREASVAISWGEIESTFPINIRLRNMGTNIFRVSITGGIEVDSDFEQRISRTISTYCRSDASQLLL